jgi:integrase
MSAIGTSLSPSAIRDIVQRYGAMVGIPDLAPHDLRRTLARLARDGGAPLESIQASLGHASIETTMKYIASTHAADAGDYLKIEREKEKEHEHR